MFPIRTTTLLTLATFASCTHRTPSTSTSHSQVKPANHSAPVTHAPASHSALHNVHPINDRIISGGVPEGDAAFDELRAMGVRTILSVDGATPDVARAQARGMRYVHIPITYAEVTEDQQLEIARALRDLPGPIFVHCHHGKHRSPAAVAAASVRLGLISPEKGVAFMKKAGTAPNYTGLYQCVADATTFTDAEINAAPDTFPSVRIPAGMVAAMIGVDEAFEHLGEIRAAAWKVPSDHPDLVPAAEAGRLADYLRHSAEDPKARALGDDFLKRLAESVKIATDLEEAIARNEAAKDLDARYKIVQASCKECHAAYRDKPHEGEPKSLGAGSSQ